MAYTMPPLALELLITTNAVAHTVTVHTILAAAPAFRAYRIVALSASVADNLAGLVQLFQVGDGVSVVGPWSGMVGTAVGGAGIVFPEPGVQLGVQQPFKVSSRSTPAAMAVAINVLYFVDSVV